ncbi:CidA/LrgA family protein [Desertibacillus haloalkaliphilus]|nr:CidA/LrgA family protein [Desertibacillus haloalkaliphilus]
MIAVFYFIGQVTVTTFHLPFPASIVGMLLLFVSLLLGFIKLEWVETVANIHLKHIILFFIPPIVGVFYYLEIFKQDGFKLTLVLILSSLVVLLVTAFAADTFVKKGENNDGTFHD